MVLAKQVSDRRMRGSPSERALYETDFHAWAMEQAATIRRLRPAGVDVDNIAEELETLGRSEKKEILSRLDVLLLHLLKFRHQPEKRKGGWEASIRVQRSRLKKVLAENPSLQRLPAQELASEYRDVRDEAIAETGLPESTFPETCPFTIEEIMDDGFFG